MSKLSEAQDILNQLGFPVHQQNEMAAFTLLALCNLKEGDGWKNAKNKSMGVSKGIMSFLSTYYKKKYAPNTRETVRRHVLHQFVQSGFVAYNPDIPNLPVNSPRVHYALTNSAIILLKSYKTKGWKKELTIFIKNTGTLRDTYEKKRLLERLPLRIDHKNMFFLSPGEHNKLQIAIIKEFAPRFIKNAQLLYLGDTEKKNLYILEDKLKAINIPIDKHSKLPDVVILDTKKNWLFLIEAVTSHGPMSAKRIFELEELLKDCKTGKIYVSAFPNILMFARYSRLLAWETEVWVADKPDHMIHYNGDKFFGPR